MNDIEERLRRDAVAWRRGDAPPDFDAAFDRAAATRPSRPRSTWLAVAAAVAVIGAVVTAVLVWPASSHTPASGDGRRYIDYLSGPADGMSWRRIDNVDFSTAIKVPGHDDRLTVLVSANTGDECSIRDPQVGEVQQGTSKVIIAITGEELLPTPNKNGEVGFACTNSLTQELQVRVPGGVGNREVYTVGTSEPATVLDPSELPVPEYLPAGFTAAGVQPLRPSENRLVAERDFRRGNDTLVVKVGAHDQMPATGFRATGHVDVNGHRAAITHVDNTCVTWSIRSSVDTSVCNVAGDGSPLSVSDVVAVARSLH